MTEANANGTRANGNRPTGPRCIALVGPFQSGKTTLLEAILARTGAIQRQGSVDAGTSVGDNSKEARDHRMSVELSVATTSFMDENYTFIDCPGSIEFLHDMRAVLPAVDAAVVVCEADEKKIPQLQLVLRELEDLNIPRFVFLNKIDKADKRLRETLQMLQPASRVPLLLRQIPIWRNGIVTGFVDLALERAHVYKEYTASQVVELSGDDLERERTARFTMLETLADHDDELMEQLLEDIPPPRDKIFDDLAKELREGQVCPVLIGVATRTNGVLRLLKALRHEAPNVETTAQRLGVKANGNDAVGYVLKTINTAHGGKMSVTRVLAGSIGDGTVMNSQDRDAGRVSGVYKMMGQAFEKRGAASAGETVALGKLDNAKTGDTLASGRELPKRLTEVTAYPPVLAISIAAKERKDDVKLGQALNKLVEEDPSITIVHNPDTHEVILWGQGEMHLRVIAERLTDRFGIAIEKRQPQVGYRETIKKTIQQRGRHRKQSGGHGQFGDVVLDIKPLGRGEGFTFAETITGGVVPRNYIPSVEEGVLDGLKQGPLGFPVVDIAVTLIDGSYHTVDSSDQAFRTAGRIGIVEALPHCHPVLLEPIHLVEIVCPNDATAKINAILSGRRGQILGFDTREGWSGWDSVRAQLPESEIGDLIVEVRSATAGVGTFTFQFDHMAELTGRTADQIVASRRAAE
ncbi:elongation factor G [Pseudorhodoplanes sinuspersici]|uniref:Elongation factor G n=1 Tax=Pseudorhodoplanes sinuspersici TaxID=1235591 RepID=A0A1W6ZRW7_9HYPH|nr:elongation factor G [Pseudorhodoplanes sinuspersici]ARQ00026.1 elongation factor G [Pseudorhodoplanes sinuspersici]RKE71060.1 translation elongation factor 2 (EF-2/EF-G) [Pseudorhodoplanes sinuspersici]